MIKNLHRLISAIIHLFFDYDKGFKYYEKYVIKDE